MVVLIQFFIKMDSICLSHFVFLFGRVVGNGKSLAGVGFAIGLFEICAFHFAFEVFFYHQTGYGSGPYATSTGIFHIHGHGNFRVVHGSKRDEYGVVHPFILGGSGFAAHNYARNVGQMGCTACSMHHVVHASGGNVEILRFDTCFVALVEFIDFGRIFAVVAHHVRGVVIAVIGHDAGQIGHLQGHHFHFALSDTVGIDCGEGPAACTILVVVVGCVGYGTRFHVG